MSSNHPSLERRASQRFDFQLPVCIRVSGDTREELGFTQDLTARGVFLYTDLPLQPGAEVELTLVMPAEVTLSSAARVCCRGRVVRVNPPVAGTRFGIGVQLHQYEYLPQTADRISVSSNHEPSAEKALASRSYQTTTPS